MKSVLTVGAFILLLAAPSFAQGRDPSSSSAASGNAEQNNKPKSNSSGGGNSGQ